MTERSYDTLCDIFVRVFALPSPDDAEEAVYGQTRGWDSLGHMTLVGEIEDAFDLLLAPEDIIDMASFARTREILSKHGIVGLS